MGALSELLVAYFCCYSILAAVFKILKIGERQPELIAGRYCQVEKADEALRDIWAVVSLRFRRVE